MRCVVSCRVVSCSRFAVCQSNAVLVPTFYSIVLSFHSLSIAMSLPLAPCAARITYGSGSSGLWVQLFVLSKFPYVHTSPETMESNQDFCACGIQNNLMPSVSHHSYRGYSIGTTTISFDTASARRDNYQTRTTSHQTTPPTTMSATASSSTPSLSLFTKSLSSFCTGTTTSPFSYTATIPT